MPVFAIPIENPGLFFAASALLALAPGPDNLFVLTQAALRGRAAGLFVTLGLCTGLIVHTLTVAIGVAAVFQTSAIAFTTLKLAGAVYLLYLAWQAFRAEPAHIQNAAGSVLNAAQLYRRGIIMNVTNPKVAIFFLAFLPQFTDPERGAMTAQLLLLGGVFMLATLLVFGAIAVTAAMLGAWLRRAPQMQRALNRIAGLVFVGLAINLAVAQR